MALVLEVEPQVAARLLRRLLQVRDLDRRRLRARCGRRAGRRWSSRSAVDVGEPPLSPPPPEETRRSTIATITRGRSPRRPRSRSSAVCAPSWRGPFRVLRALRAAAPLFFPAIRHRVESLVGPPRVMASPPRPLPGPRGAQRAEHGAGRRRPVERVEVDSRARRRAAARRTAGPRRRRRARTRPARLPPAAANAASSRGGIEASQSSQIRFVWAKLATGMTPAMIGTSIPARPRRGDEVEVDLVVEEELGDQEGGARVDLRLQVVEVGVEVGRLRMDLGEAGAADREVPAGGDELRQLGGAAQPALGLDEVRLCRGAGRRAGRRRSRSRPRRSGRGSRRAPPGSRRRSSGAPSSPARARP